MAKRNPRKKPKTNGKDALHGPGAAEAWLPPDERKRRRGPRKDLAIIEGALKAFGERGEPANARLPFSVSNATEV